MEDLLRECLLQRHISKVTLSIHANVTQANS